MSHKPSFQLQDELNIAASQVKVGAAYAHYKHPDQLYRVIQLLIIEATEEVGVVYQAEYGDRTTFVRPLSSFINQIDLKNSTVPRFGLVDPQ
ncbi:MAG: hypothetical protein NVSMB39_0970 [Candidatus Saccharimonadales bacterium]